MLETIPYAREMEVAQARAFVAVAEELHFGRAAARLHIGRASLSRLIRALEDQLGATLFIRDSRNVALSATGEMLLQPARELVMHSDRLSDTVHRIQRGEIERVRLGFAGASVSAVVGALVDEVRRARPLLSVALSGTQLSQPGLDQLRSGSLDVVVGRWDSLPSNVESCLLAREELRVVLPENHRLSGLRSVRAADLADESWIVLPGGGGATLSNRLHELGKRGSFVPRIVETVLDSATQLLMVQAGNGIALTFSGVEQNLPGGSLVFRPVEQSLGDVAIRLAWRQDDDNSAVRAVVQAAHRLTANQTIA